MLRLFLLLWALPRALRLTWRLMRDRRVSGGPKALPVFAFLYLIWPFDLRPDYIPVVGLVDDAIVITICLALFRRICPPNVVREHEEVVTGKVLEGRFRIVDETDGRPWTVDRGP